jgi:hypothetical protein
LLRKETHDEPGIEAETVRLDRRARITPDRKADLHQLRNQSLGISNPALVTLALAEFGKKELFKLRGIDERLRAGVAAIVV